MRLGFRDTSVWARSVADCEVIDPIAVDIPEYDDGRVVPVNDVKRRGGTHCNPKDESSDGES